MNWIKYIILGAFLSLINACGNSSDGSSGESTNSSILKKTGQSKSYDVDGTELSSQELKDDGFYQKGLTPKYSRDKERKIVTDNITGLEWQDNILVKKNWISSEVYAQCSDFHGNPACSDTECVECQDVSGDTATTYCSNLDLDGKGWRLPTTEELFYIVDKGRDKPSINSIFKFTSSDDYFSANIIKMPFPLLVNFDGGFVDISKIKSFNYATVRCVRGKKNSLVGGELREEKKETLKSLKTALEWQNLYEDNFLKESNWQDAIHYCEALDLNGSNWRLPNINELYSLFNKKGEINTNFLYKSSTGYWSSSSFQALSVGELPSVNQVKNKLAWVMNANIGKNTLTTGRDKSAIYNVICVRNK